MKLEFNFIIERHRASRRRSGKGSREMSMDFTFGARRCLTGRAVAVAIFVVAAWPAACLAAEAKGDEDLKAQVEALRAEVARLQQHGESAERVTELERRIDLLAAELE